MTKTYLESTIRVFNTYKKQAEDAMAQVDDNGLFWAPNAESNSIAIIVKHLWGNMLSRWTDFLTTDGEKPWRQRDDEFINDWDNREILLKKWNEGWQCVFDTLNSLTESDLQKTVYIRGEAHTVIDAINRQIAHYSAHIGQIVYLAKLIKKMDGKAYPYHEVCQSSSMKRCLQRIKNNYINLLTCLSADEMA